MRKTIALLAALVVAALSVPAAAAPAPSVSTEAELRSAFASGTSPIRLAADIKVSDPLEWSDDSALVIEGGGHSITGDGTFEDAAVVWVRTGADVSLSQLTITDGGSYSISDPGGNSALRVDIPADATGTVSVDTRQVVISNTGLHGIHVDDNNGSDASVEVTMVQTRIENSGLGGFDEDGLRVDERGDGDIIFTSRASDFVAAGADGVELDEGGDGDVTYDVANSDFIDNGNYCSFRLEVNEEGRAAIVTEGEIEVEVALDAYGSVDETITDLAGDDSEVAACLEDGIEEDGDVWVIGIDLDDAFDIDEAGDGSIVGVVRNARLIDNFDEGLDFDEEDEGDIAGAAVSVRAYGNVDEAIKYSEEGDGDVFAKVSGTQSDGDVEFEEADAGNVDASIAGSAFDDITLVEEDSGSLTYRVVGTSYDDLEVESTD